MTSNLVRWVNELDCISSQLTRNGFAEFNAMPWFSYLAFDIIGDLAFGAPFGMVVKGRNEIEVQLTPGAPISYAPAVEVLNRRGEVSSTLGLLPALRPYAGYLPDPFFTKGISAVKNLNGIAVAAVRSRIDAAEKESKETTTETIFWPDYCKVKTQMEIKWGDKKSQPKPSPNSLLGLTPSQTHHAQFSTGSCMVNVQLQVLSFRGFRPNSTPLFLRHGGSIILHCQTPSIPQTLH